MERFFASLLSGRGKLMALIEVGRPWNGLLIILMALFGFLLFSSSFSYTGILLSIALPMLIYMASTTMNDVHGFESDKVNCPYRPLVRGHVTLREVTLFAAFLYAIGLLTAFFISLPYFISILLFSLWGLVYSHPPLYFERRGLLGSLWLGFGTALIPAYSGIVLVSGTLFSPIEFWLLFGSFSLFISSFLIIKDFKDIKGDKKIGKLTFVIRVGVKNALIISMFGMVFFLLTTLYLFNLFINNTLIFLLSVFLFPLLFYDYRLLKKHSVKNSEKAYSNARVMVLLISIGMFLFLLGKLFF